MSYDLSDEYSAGLNLYENWDDFKRDQRQGRDPIEIKKKELQQERLYKEYIKKCGFGKNHSPKLGKLNPYWFSDELKNSIPKEEFLKLVDAYYDKAMNFSIKRMVVIAIILILIALYGLYAVVRDYA